MKAIIVRGAVAALLSVAVLPAVPVAGLAAPAKAPAKAADPLALTPAQQAKFNAIQKQYAAEMTAIQKGSGTPQQKQAKAQATSKKYHDQEMAVLTPAQRTKVNQLITQRKALMEQQMARQKQVMEVQKTLTPAQKTKLDAIRAKYTPKMQAIYSDKKLSPQQKMTQLQALNQKAVAESRAVLTPKQRAALPQ